MIGVETLPEKKKSEYWKFDEGVYPDSSKPLLITQPTSDSPPVYKADAENKFGFEADVRGSLVLDVRVGARVFLISMVPNRSTLSTFLALARRMSPGFTSRQRPSSSPT